MTVVLYRGVLPQYVANEVVDWAEGICQAEGDVLYDHPRYLVVHADKHTHHILHERVIATLEPREQP